MNVKLLMILCLINFLFQELFCQNSLLIKGYVIDDFEFLPDVEVSVAGKDYSTRTNIRGKFKIKCLIGDTLIFKHPDRKIKEEKYHVQDNSLVIIRMIRNIKLLDNGKEELFGSVRRLIP